MEILNKNTFINKPKTTHNKPFNKNLSNPVSNKNIESSGQKTRYLRFEIIDVNDKLFFFTFNIAILKVNFFSKLPRS